MMNRIQTTVATMVLTGLLALPVWAQIVTPTLPTLPPPTSCPSIVAEMEPNDLHNGQDIQDLGFVPAGACVTVSPARIESGASSQTPDVDFYVLGVGGAAQLSVELLTQGQTPFFYAIFDHATGDILAECYETTCQAALQTDYVVIGVIAEDVAEYHLAVTAAGSQSQLLSADPQTSPLAEMQERVLKLR